MVGIIFDLNGVWHWLFTLSKTFLSVIAVAALKWRTQRMHWTHWVCWTHRMPWTYWALWYIYEFWVHYRLIFIKGFNWLNLNIAIPQRTKWRPWRTWRMWWFWRTKRRTKWWKWRANRQSQGTFTTLKQLQKSRLIRLEPATHFTIDSIHNLMLKHLLNKNMFLLLNLLPFLVIILHHQMKLLVTQVISSDIRHHHLRHLLVVKFILIWWDWKSAQYLLC